MVVGVVLVQMVDDGFDLLRMILIGILGVSIRTEGPVSRWRSVCPSEARIDTARGECVEHAELLGDFERTIVVEKHRTGAKPDRVGFGGKMPE